MPATARAVRLLALVVLAACGGSERATAPAGDATADATTVAPPSVAAAPGPVTATVGSALRFDAAQGGAFRDPLGRGLTIAVRLEPAAPGLDATGALVAGTPLAPGVHAATVTATDAAGRSASYVVPLVVFAAGLRTPALPVTLAAYSDSSAPLPAHFRVAPPNGAPGLLAADNTPASNRVTDAGATLGRVLFYERRLSVNDAVSCGSCHVQAAGFADTARLSRGVRGLTARHSMALANARFYQSGRFFWDERAPTLEAQVLQPIQDATEMGLTLDQMVTKLRATPYYPALFAAAFGTPEISAERVSRALAQFVRALTSSRSRFDRAFAGNGPPNFAGVLTPEEAQGEQLFTGQAGCGACHGTVAQIADAPRNNGLDRGPVADSGAGGGRFKAPSLRNVAVRAPYMHDGRFTTLEQVVAFYDAGVQPSPGLDPRLRLPNGQPRRLNLSAAQRDALVAYLRTLTDPTFLTDARFADPFRAP